MSASDHLHAKMSVGAAQPAQGPAAPKQTRHQDKLLMLAATVARMVVGMLTFIVMARYLGPVKFGVIATAIAYSTFIGIVTDYGLGVSTIRTASAAPEDAQTIVSRAIATKVLLTLGATAIAAIAAVAIVPAAQWPVYAVAYLGVITYAFADLTMVAARARRRFEVEAAIVVGSSTVMMIVVAGTAFLTRDALATALAFTGTRVLYLGATLVTLRRTLGIVIGWWRPLPEIWAVLRLSSSYALDSILTSLSSQIDVLVFGALLSAHDIGVYQAGARLVQVIMPFATVLSTVYMPVLASAAINDEAGVFRKNSRRINIEFTALALVGGLGFVFIGPVFTRLVYGDHYAALAPLWGGFGAFALLRLAAAGYGIQLAAMGFIRMRIAAQVAAILGFLAVAAWAMPLWGLSVTSWILAASAVLTLLVLGLALARDRRTDASVWISLMAALAATVLIRVVAP